MYALARRPDTKVVDEPLYAHYLAHQPTTAIHPGREEIMTELESDETTLVAQMTTQNYGREIVVFKQMTHHLSGFSRTSKVAMLGLDQNADADEPIHNVLLLRDPRKILASFAKVVDEVTAEDIGLPQQYELFKELKTAGKLTAILEAKQLLLNPASVLKELCRRLKISYTDRMLSWPAGPIPEDGVWAKYWYENVHQSTGFQPYVEKDVQLDSELEEIAQRVMPLYEEMMSHSSSVRSSEEFIRPDTV
ncbi:hypothetical protein CEQ90_10005 [Lewinellaceae bacterium SD302]|nr:hypothetical protein CEQ90_10005 [Lewinellaceae bacterium SD302]